MLILYTQLSSEFQKFTRYMTEKGLPVSDNPLPSKDHAYKKNLFASSIRMSTVITLLQFRLSLLFFVLFYGIMSVFTAGIHTETKVASILIYLTYVKLAVYLKPDLSLSIIRHAIHLHRLYITVLQQRMLCPSQYPLVRLCGTIILPQIHNLFHIFGINQ